MGFTPQFSPGLERERLLAVPCAAPGSGISPGPMPVAMETRLGAWGGVELGAAGKENMLRRPSLVHLPLPAGWFEGLPQGPPPPVSVPPVPMQSGFRSPLSTSSFSCHLSKQPGKVGPPVPMFLTGTWKPRREPVEASRI